MPAPLPEKIYSRHEISQLVGGSPQWYLPRREGRVVAGCFDPSLNLRAPAEIDVGAGDQIRKSARLLFETGDTVPVFLKLASSQWRYTGDFRATGLSTAPRDLEAPWRRPDAAAVLFLEEVDTPAENDDLLVSLFATEGRAQLKLHRTRERRRSLVEAKKRVVKAQFGTLLCEACGARADHLPSGIGEACFEVHHLVPLSEASGEVITRLDDLALLCANCHRMIHATSPLVDLPYFKSLFQRSRGDA